MSNQKSSSWTGQGWQVGEWHAGDQPVLHQPFDVPTQVPVPDIWVQIKDPVMGHPPCLSDEGRLEIEGLIRAAIQLEFPGAYVDSRCARPGLPAEEAAAFGIWTEPPDPLTDAQIEEMHTNLARSIGRPPDKTIAFLIKEHFVRRLAQRAWKPLRVDDQGIEQLDGDFHLNTLRVEMQPPARVATIIEGFVESALPDPHITVTIAETFQVELGKIRHTTVKNIGGDITFNIIRTVLSGFDLLTGQSEPVAPPSPDEPDDEKLGVGSQVQDRFMPPAILIKGGMKRPIGYASPFEVRPEGMFVAGFLGAEEQRQPTVKVKGRSSITAAKGQGTVVGHFQAGPSDLRAPLTYAWTSDDEVVLDPDNPYKVKVRFTPTPGQARLSRVTVTVTDADGLSATDTKKVNVSVVEVQGPRGQGGSGSNNPQVEQ